MNRGARGMKPGVEHPGKLFKRLLHYIFQEYKIQYIMVMILIVVSVLANVQGTMFMKDLIDKYITPFLLTEHPNFAPLAHAIAKVAVYNGIGVIST